MDEIQRDDHTVFVQPEQLLPNEKPLNDQDFEHIKEEDEFEHIGDVKDLQKLDVEAVIEEQKVEKENAFNAIQ